MAVWSFDVTVSTHDLLALGVIEARMPGAQEHHHRVVVEAVSYEDASLLAAQMVSCHGMCTGVYVRV